jgi:GMP synthase-like glutamine amidotransferase
MSAGTPRALVVEHQRDAPAGLVVPWAAERGLELSTLRPAEEPGRWPAPGDHDAVVVLGSDCSVARSPDPWIAEEIAFVRAAHGAGVPVLGLCFGAQSLAAALGGAVDRAAHDEIGWLTFDAVDERFTGPFFAWHGDAFTVPPGAQELARSSAGPQAYSAGAAVGVQFHPEVDEAIVDAWLEWGRSQLVEARLDEDAIREQTARVAPDARRRAFALFDLWARAWLPASARAAAGAPA